MATPEEFEEFVGARYPALVRTARFLVADASTAEDLVQDALVKCVGAWPRIKGDPEGYVRTVMVRTNISRWRRVGCGSTLSNTCQRSVGTTPTSWRQRP